MTNQRNVSRLAVFITLAIGLTAVGASSAIFLFSHHIKSYQLQTTASLRTFSELAASIVNAEALESLKHPNQERDPEFIAETRKLESAIKADSRIAHISVVKQFGPGYRFLIDSAQEGPKKSKSKLLDPYDETPAELAQAVADRSPVVTSTPHTDRWGTWQSAFAPVFNQKGDLTAIVIADIDAKLLDAGENELNFYLQLTLIVVTVLCLGMAWLVSGAVTAGIKQTNLWSNKPWRRIVAEVTLLGVVVFSVIDTTNTAFHHRKSNQNQAHIANHQNQPTRNAILVGIVAAACAGLIRFSAYQERILAETQQTNEKIQSQLSSIFDHLPIGLFVIEQGEITLANAEWRKQIEATQEAQTLEQLGRKISPTQREAVLATIGEASKTARPFNLKYEIVKQGQEPMRVETQGVPVYDLDGVCRRLLAFTIDLTPAHKAQETLEATYVEVENKNRLLGQALAELEENLESVVKALIKAVEAKDPYTAGHSERVMQYSLWLGEAIGLGPYELRVLELGTLVHDVGKIGIPDAILTKPDKLTDAEYDIIKKHPEYGVNIIGNIGMFRECLPIVRWHHERLDGRGYPDQLKGEEIPVLVRISAIADIFDAMTSTRAYRKGMELSKVLGIMSEIADKGEIDPDLFATFCQVVNQKGIINQQVQQEPWKAA